MTAVGMRAFLQRGETRLSTLHATLGAFIGGAGLLTLFPLFFYNSMFSVVELFEEELLTHQDLEVFPGLLTMLWIWPILCSFIIPLISLYQLIYQLAITYIDPQSNLFHLPRFSLFAISLPRDEGSLEEEIRFHPRALQLVIPINERAKERQTVERRSGATEQSEAPQALVGVFKHQALVAGQDMLTMAEHASLLEAHLIRFNIALRVIIIRYIKSLIAFVWTLIIVTTYLALVKPKILVAPSLHPIEYLGLVVGLVWASFAPTFVALPLGWIGIIGDQNTSNAGAKRDLHLIGFERTVLWFCLIASATSTVGLALVNYKLDTSDGEFLGFTTLVLGIFCWGALLRRFWDVFLRK